MGNKPTYYAMIPPQVRYDDDLKANEKLLYGEIFGHISIHGACFLTNGNLSELYNVTKTSISIWIANLEEQGYIATQYFMKEGYGIVRKISIREKQRKGSCN